MDTSSHSSPHPRVEQPSRIGAARQRAAAARRGLAWGAVVSFGAMLVVVRSTHPAKHHASAGLAAPAALLAEIQGAGLGGGSIAPAAGAPSVATSTS